MFWFETHAFVSNRRRADGLVLNRLLRAPDQGMEIALSALELFRHSRAFRIFDGTSEIQRLIIAKKVLENR